MAERQRRPRRTTGPAGAGRGSSSESFISSGERPDISTLLETPIRDLTARQVMDVFAAFQIPTASIPDPVSPEFLEELIPDEFLVTVSEDSLEEDFDQLELEGIYTELAALNIPNADFRSVPVVDLLTYIQSLNVPSELLFRLPIGRIKRLIDKGVRDNKGRIDKAARDNKPRIDKAIRDKAQRDKSAIDKAARDSKSRVDKSVADTKTRSDKTLRDTKNQKDINDKPRIDKTFADKEPAKEAKDIVETFGAVTPSPVQPNLGDLARRIQTLEAEFSEIAAIIRSSGPGAQSS